MATPGAEFATRRRKVADDSGLPSASEAELQELESEISSHRERPQSVLLKNVIERLSAITLADGAAIAVCDQWGVVCRASVGEAPEVGSRLRPDSALTREAFETAQVVVCEDTETDYRGSRSTAKSLRLRSRRGCPHPGGEKSFRGDRGPFCEAPGFQRSPCGWITSHRRVAGGSLSSSSTAIAT